MPDVVVSRAAQLDLQEMVRHTTMRWGAVQAHQYSAEMRTCFQQLAEHPLMGRTCDEISPGLRRHEKVSHIVFYRIRLGGVRISRVLHRRMLPKQRRFEL